MALINEYNYKAYLASYAFHFNKPIHEARKEIEANPQVLEDYAEYLDNRGY